MNVKKEHHAIRKRKKQHLSDILETAQNAFLQMMRVNLISVTPPLSQCRHKAHKHQKIEVDASADQGGRKQGICGKYLGKGSGIYKLRDTLAAVI